MGIKSIAISVAVMAIISGGYYVINLNNNLNDALSENEKLEESVKEQRSLLESQRNDIEQIKTINEKQREIISNQRDKIRELDDKFNTSSSGEERDFGEIAAAKPGLVRGIINEATADVNRCFEIATGSEINEEDMNNEECEDIIDSP